MNVLKGLDKPANRRYIHKATASVSSTLVHDEMTKHVRSVSYVACSRRAQTTLLYYIWNGNDNNAWVNYFVVVSKLGLRAQWILLMIRSDSYC